MAFSFLTPLFLLLTGSCELQGDHEVDGGLWGASKKQCSGGDFTEDFQDLQQPEEVSWDVLPLLDTSL